MNFSKRLYETAKQDLNSVQTLYDSKHFNLALFQLQQSVEKFVKSFGVMADIIEPKDVARKINHLPHKVFSRYFQSQITEMSKRDNSSLLIPDFIPPHQRGISSVKANLRSAENIYSKVSNADFKKIKAITDNELKEFIEGTKVLEIDPVFADERLFSNFKDDIVKTQEHFIEYFRGDKEIKKRSLELIKQSDKIAREKVVRHKQYEIEQNKFNYICFVWINLSLITSPHEQLTRYPSLENEDAPTNLYSDSHVLIQYLPEFVTMMKKSLVKYQEIYGE